MPKNTSKKGSKKNASIIRTHKHTHIRTSERTHTHTLVNWTVGGDRTLAAATQSITMNVTAHRAQRQQYIATSSYIKNEE